MNPQSPVPNPQFLGYRRPDGRCGTRNHVLVVPTVICSAVVAERVAASAAPVSAALPHLAGCGQLGPDMGLTHDTLAAYCGHPNVGAVLVIALGCEQVVAQTLAAHRQAPRQARRDHRDPVRGRHRPHDREGRADRGRARGAARESRAAGVRRLRADPVAEVRWIRLHLGAGVEPDARPRHRPARRSRRQRGARRNRRDHGCGAPARGAREQPGGGTGADSDHLACRSRGTRARARHPRHAAVARQHPRRPDHHRREIARRHAQGGRAARRSKTSFHYAAPISAKG